MMCESENYKADQGITVLPDQTLVANCVISNNGNNNLSNLKIDLITHRRDQFGDIVSKNVIEQDISLKAKSTQNISFEIPAITIPQSYDVDTFLVNSSMAKVSPSTNIHYVVNGSSATIQNTILDKTAYKKGDTANVQIFWTVSGSAKNVLKVTISDNAGNVCGNATKSSSSSLISLSKESLKVSIEKECAGAVATVSISDDKGNVLDSTKINLNNPTSSVNINPEISSASTINGINKIYLFVFLIVLVLVGYGITSLRKSQNLNGN
jgi:hypothetical protein